MNVPSLIVGLGIGLILYGVIALLFGAQKKKKRPPATSEQARPVPNGNVKGVSGSGLRQRKPVKPRSLPNSTAGASYDPSSVQYGELAARAMEELIELTQSDASAWTPAGKVGKRVSVESRTLSYSGSSCYRGTGTINAPPLAILEIIRERRFEWDEGLDKKEEVEVVSRQIQVNWQSMKAKWLTTARDMCVLSTAATFVENGVENWFLAFKSIEHAACPPAKSHVRVNVNIGGWWLRCAVANPEVTTCVNIAQLHLGGSLPAAAMNIPAKENMLTMEKLANLVPAHLASVGGTWAGHVPVVGRRNPYEGVPLKGAEVQYAKQYEQKSPASHEYKNNIRDAIARCACRALDEEHTWGPLPFEIPGAEADSLHIDCILENVGEPACVRGRGTVNAPMAWVRELLLDYERRGEWDPENGGIVLVEELNANAVVTRRVALAAAPARPRETVVVSDVVDLANATVIAYTSVLHDDCPLSEGADRTNVYFAGFVLQQSRNGGTIVTYVAHVDSGGGMPSRLGTGLLARQSHSIVRLREAASHAGIGAQVVPPDVQVKLQKSRLATKFKSEPHNYATDAANALDALLHLVTAEEVPWVFSKKGGKKADINVSSLVIHGLESRCVRGVGLIRAPAAKLFEILIDPTKRVTWEDQVLESYVVEELDEFCRIVYHATKGRWLASERDMCVLAQRAHFHDADGAEIFAIGIRSVEHPTCLPKPGRVRAEVGTGGWVLKASPHDPNTTEATYLMQVELKGLVPKLVAEQVVKDQVNVIENLRKFAQS